MAIFGSGMSAAPAAVDAARAATADALKAFGDVAPKLALVFASPSYADVGQVQATVERRLGVPTITMGGTSGGGVFGTGGVARVGVSIVLLGGDDIEVVVRVAQFASPTLIEAVPAAEAVAAEAGAAAKRGFVHYTCIILAPGMVVDGEALVAAIRKGAGAHAQLAGGLTGDDFTMDRPDVFIDRQLRRDHVVIAGIFSKKPVGIAARHGWRPVGPTRRITGIDGVHLTELDGRPALDVWLEDARRAGAEIPPARGDIALYLANHYELGIVQPRIPMSKVDGGGAERELVARAPFALRDDGAVQLSASISEGTHVRLLHATRDDLLCASVEAAQAASRSVGAPIAGALLFACSGRLAALGEDFAKEPAAIQAALGAPIGGACVFGEIARNVRDVDAFFNTTAVVVAFSA